MYEVVPGSGLNISCVAVGSPMPYVKWRKGAIDLTPEDSTPVGKNILYLKNIQESANYTCIAVSKLGPIEATAQVMVQGLLSCTISLAYLYRIPTLYVHDICHFQLCQELQPTLGFLMSPPPL